MLRTDLKQLKVDIYDIIKERERSELNKYDQVIIIFFEENEEVFYRWWLKAKENFLRDIEVEANAIYLDLVKDLENYGSITE